MLGRLGYQSLCASNGLEALEVFRPQKAHLEVVVLDLSMPVMDGEQTLGELRRLAPALPIIVMSGYSEAELEARFTGRGVTGYLPKPFNFAALESAIRAAMRLSRENR